MPTDPKPVAVADEKPVLHRRRMLMEFASRDDNGNLIIDESRYVEVIMSGRKFVQIIEGVDHE